MFSNKYLVFGVVAIAGVVYFSFKSTSVNKADDVNVSREVASASKSVLNGKKVPGFRSQDIEVSHNLGRGQKAGEEMAQISGYNSLPATGEVVETAAADIATVASQRSVKESHLDSRADKLIRRIEYKADQNDIETAIQNEEIQVLRYEIANTARGGSVSDLQLKKRRLEDLLRSASTRF